MALNFQQNGSASMRRVLLVVLLVASLALATLYAREGENGPLHTVQNAVAGAVAPFKFAGAAVDDATSSMGDGLADLTADETSLTSLREENQQLRNLLSQADEYKQEAERLEGLLNLKNSYDIDGVAARVVGKSIEAYDQFITIDAGSADGVNTGMTVMGSSGVIGQVFRTTERTADVRLLTDSKSGAAALVQSSRAEGIVRGSLEGLLYLENIDETKVPQVGDVIVTSGLGGSYVRGLIIGTVVRVDTAAGNATGRIVVSPNDTAASLEEVLVVKSLNSEGALGNTAQNGGNANASGDAGTTDGDGDATQDGTNDDQEGGETS
ncbi:MAG TPA: rod shape-determining protein MreC [Candidatus Gordonibacter avicola]|nr:rod shape-determining protein MreC [Candidatus Gordonibacter avicola]